MYLLNAEATIQWELLPTATPPVLADLDLILISPHGDTTYLDAPIDVADYTAPTDTLNGEVIYRFTPQIEGFWRIRLVTGDSANYRILSKVEMFVFDSTTSTTPHADEVGRSLPYDINFFMQGFIVPNEVFGIYVASRHITLATDAPNSEAVAKEFANTIQTTFKVFHNDAEIGAVVFSPQSKIGAITINPTIIVPGDYISVITQGSTVDPAISDIAINLVGCCTVVPCTVI